MQRALRPLVAGLSAAALSLGLVAAGTTPVSAATPAPRPIVTGWMPYWDTTDALNSVLANSDLIDDVSPFWYSARGNSPSITIASQIGSTTAANATAAMHAQGIRVLPSITDGSGRLDMSAQMSTSSGRAHMVGEIVSLVTSKGYDGIDLDWEGFAFNDGQSSWTTTRVRWVAFVKALSAALHARGKLLAITAPAGLGTTSDSTGYWVYAWSEIGPYVDRLRIMAYDYSVSNAGPIAPYAWVDKVLAKAVTQVSSRKIQIGVPSYGRDWKTSISGTCPNVALDPATSSTFLSKLAWAKNRHEFSARGAASYVSGLFVTEAATVAGIRRLSVPVATWDPVVKEKTFSYSLAFSGRYQPASVSVAPVSGLAGGLNVIVSTTSGLSVGDRVTGTGIGALARITAISGQVLTLSVANSASVIGRLTVTNLTTGVARSTVAVGGYASGTTVRVLSASGVTVGSAVTGTGIAAGARVTGVSSHVLTLDTPHTGNVATTVTTQPASSAATCTIARKGWYGEAGSAVAAAALVGKYKLAGIAQWTIGGEDTAQWAPLRSYATSIAQAPTAVSLSAPTALYVGRSSTLNVYVSSNGAPVAGAPVVLLFKPSTSATWARMGTGVTGADGRVAWRTPAATVSGSWRSYVYDSWYRFSGNDVAAETVVRRAATAVALTATARVAPGGLARATARVTSLGAPVAGAYVNFWWKPTNSASWVVVGKAITDANGAAVRAVLPKTSGYWRASVGATTTRLSFTTTANVLTSLVPKVTLTATTISVKAGAVAAIRATTNPAGAGQVVTVQRASGASWVNVVNLSTDAYGRVAWRVPTSTKGAWKYRLYVHATTKHASGFSLPVAVTVS